MSHNEHGEGSSRDDFTPAQTEKLQQYMDFTNKQDPENAKEVLQRHNWDVPSAIAAALDGSPLPPSPPPVVPRAPLPRNQPYNRSPRVITPPHLGVTTLVYNARRPNNEGFLKWSIMCMMSSFRSVYQVVLRMIFGDPRDRISDSLGDVRSFVQEFKKNYPGGPSFIIDTYGEAKKKAQKDYKMLLLYMHDADHTDTDAFCAGTLCHQDVVEFTKENMIVWGCSIQNPEGYRVHKLLRNPTSPFLAVVSLQNRTMAIVARLNGPLVSEELMSSLNEVKEKCQPSLTLARLKQQELDESKIIRLQQDEAYKRSLEVDRQKASARQKEHEEKLEKSLILEEKKKAKETKEETHKDRKLACAANLPDECTDVEKGVHLRIRLSNNTLVARVFSMDDSVKVLHDFVYSHENLYLLEVWRQYPRQMIQKCSTKNIDAAARQESACLPTLAQAGLRGRETLVVNADDSENSTDSGADSE